MALLRQHGASKIPSGFITKTPLLYPTNLSHVTQKSDFIFGRFRQSFRQPYRQPFRQLFRPCESNVAQKRKIRGKWGSRYILIPQKLSY